MVARSKPCLLNLIVALAVASCTSIRAPAVAATVAAKARTDEASRAEPLQTVDRPSAPLSVSSTEPAPIDGTSPSNPENLTTSREVPNPDLTLELEAVVPEGSRQRPSGDVAGAVADEALQTWNYGGRSEPSYVSNRTGYHPGTRVVVDATPRFQRKAARSKAAIALSNRLVAGLRNRGYWPFRNCFENETRGTPDPGGKTYLRVSLNSQGSVVSVRFVQSSIRTKAVGRCIANAMRTLRTDRPLGKRIDADVVVATYPGDLPLLELPVERTNKLVNYAEIDRILSERRASFVSCFSAARQADSKLWGRLLLAFSVDSEGQPTEIRERESHFGDPKASECVRLALGSLRFPTSERSERLQIGFRLPRPSESLTAPNEQRNATADEENASPTSAESEGIRPASEAPLKGDANVTEPPSGAIERTHRLPDEQR